MQEYVNNNSVHLFVVGNCIQTIHRSCIKSFKLQKIAIDSRMTKFCFLSLLQDPTDTTVYDLYRTPMPISL